MTHALTAAALSALCPGAQFTLHGDVIEWLDSTQPEPMPETLVAELLHQEQLAARKAAKQQRAAAVAAITVTTAAGRTFNGDEESQSRMARAILALSTLPATSTTTWVLANNTPTQVTATELTEALALAGAAQTALWVLE